MKHYSLQKVELNKLAAHQLHWTQFKWYERKRFCRNRTEIYLVFSLLEGVPTKFPVILKMVWSLDSYVEDVTFLSGKMVEREDVYCNVSHSQPGLALTSLVVHKISVCLNYNAKMLFYS